jgi:hypothetical protein
MRCWQTGHWETLLLPSTIASVETLAIVDKLKGPPSCHAGELAATHAVCLAVRSYCGEQVEEVEYNALASVRFDAEGDEGIKGVAGEV